MAKVMRVVWSAHPLQDLERLGEFIANVNPEAAVQVIEALERLKMDYRLVGAASAYNSGKSTQIPASLEIKTSPRFKRVLSVGRSKLNG